jgi:predicted TIM-barrel fold metal-dependent hydrolase
LESLPLIISVDDHLVEPPDLWQRWLPQRFTDRGPKVIRAGFDLKLVKGAAVERMTSSGPEVDWWVYGDVCKTLPMVSHWAGRTREELARVPLRFDEMRPGYYEPEARLADMDLNHTERSMCFPNVLPRFCGQTFLEHDDHELGLACVQAYNDFVVDEWCGDSGGRLIPLCIVPLWDPVLAAAEVRRNAVRGARAITFSELPPNLGLPSIHSPDRYWDPLFEACNETSTVICMHIGSGSKMMRTSDDAPVGVGITLTSVNAMMSLSDWLLSGVLIRFPRLKIAYSESQIGWMPFMLERIDNVFVKSRSWAGLDSALTELPSSQVPGRVFGCFFEDDFGVFARHSIGIDQITFEVDYPHQDTTWPMTVEYLQKAVVDLPPDDVYKIVRGNALRMLDLPETL